MTWLELAPVSTKSGAEFIVVDGMDGTGKSTTIENVARELECRGRQVIVTKSPTDFARTWSVYQDYLYRPHLRPEITYRAITAVITGDRLQHAHQVIEPALLAGATVVCDRYVYSALAHVLARDLPIEGWFRQLLGFLPQPTRAVLLTGDLDAITARIRARADSKASFVEPGFVEKLHASYEAVARSEGIELLDTTRLTPTDVCESILN